MKLINIISISVFCMAASGCTNDEVCNTIGGLNSFGGCFLAWL